jgi:hypothetical protein
MGLVIDLVNDVTSVNALAPQALTASTQGSSNDFSNCEISTNAILDVGSFGANSTSLTVQIEESATGTGSWTAIPNMVFTAVTTSNQHQVVRGLRTHRYCRANAITVSGTTPSIEANVEIIAQNKYVAVSGQQGGYSRSPST